jgi:hypothetical protein
LDNAAAPLIFGKIQGGIATKQPSVRGQIKMAGARPAIAWHVVRGAGYFQPDSLSQAARSAGCDFSHVEIDWVSLSLILLFMQVQYFRMMASDALPLLSATHRLIHFTSSVVAAKAAFPAKHAPPSTSNAVAILMCHPYARSLRPDDTHWPWRAR